MGELRIGDLENVSSTFLKLMSFQQIESLIGKKVLQDIKPNKKIAVKKRKVKTEELFLKNV